MVKISQVIAVLEENETSYDFENESENEIYLDKASSQFIYVNKESLERVEDWSYEYSISKIKEIIDKENDDDLKLAFFVFNDDEQYLLFEDFVHDSTVIRAYIEQVNDEKVKSILEISFYGKGKYHRFKEILSIYDLFNDYYLFKDKYYYNASIKWCEDNNIKYLDDKK